MNIEWIHQAVSCICPSCFFLRLMKAILGGSTDLRPDFSKSAWQTEKRKWGHGGTLERCSSFLAVLKGTPGYYSSLVLLIMHAEGFYCPSCSTNCGMRICHRPLDAAWKEDPFFIFIHGRVSTQMTLLAAELSCMKRPVLLPVLYVEIVVHFPTGTAKKIKANKKPPKSIQPLIYFLFPGNHLEYLFFIDSFFYSSVLTHGELGQSVIYSNIMEKAVMGVA